MDEIKEIRDLLVDILNALKNTEHNNSCSSRFVTNKNTPNSEKLEYGKCDCMRDATITRIEKEVAEFDKKWFDEHITMTIENLPNIAPKQLEGDQWVALRKDLTKMKRVNKDYVLLPTEVFVEFGPDIISIQNCETAIVGIPSHHDRK